MNSVDAKWADLARQHEMSLGRYISLAESLEEERWRTPIGEGKWTPIEITKHLRASYEIVIDELNGGKGMKLRTKRWMRPIIRMLYLPKILRTRQMPKNIKAPAEIRPINCIEDRTAALLRLREFGELAQNAVGDRRHDPNAYATHYLLGEIKPLKGIEFLTIHLEHHTRQLPVKDD